jgi:hypothetical protein
VKKHSLEIGAQLYCDSVIFVVVAFAVVVVVSPRVSAQATPIFAAARL